MSVLNHCSRCGDSWESGWGDDADDLCSNCRARADRLASGGHSLSGAERGMVAEFLGADVGGDGAFVVAGRLNGMVWGADDAGGFHDHDAVEPIAAFPASLIP